MLQYNPTVSGSLTVTGTISATQGITGSFSGSIAGLPTDTLAFSSSLSTRITNTELTSSEYVSTSGSLSTRVTAAEATSSAFVAASGSLSTRVTDAEATASAFVTASGSLAGRISSNEARTGSFATTGSNQFNGSQTITGSLTATETIVAQTLVVQTITSSVDFVTGSAKFGSTTGNTHQFTGSVLVSGSQTINGALSGAAATFNGALDGNIISANSVGSTQIFLKSTGAGANRQWQIQSNETVAGDLSFMQSTVAGGSSYATKFNIGASGAVTFSGSVGINSGDFRYRPSGDVTNSPALVLKVATAGILSVCAEVIGDANVDSNSLSLRVSNPTSGRFDALTILPSGNVGIGTTSPSAQTEIRVNTNDYGNNLLLSNTYPASGIATSISFGHNTQAADPDIMARISGYVDDRTSGNRLGSLRFYTGNAGTVSERMRITSGGSVGIGTTNPSDILDVQKNQNATTNFYFKNTDTTNASSRAYLNVVAGSTTLTLATLNSGDVYIAGTSGKSMYFQQNIGGTVNMFIDNSGNIGIGTTSPLQTSSNRIVTTINGTTSAVLNLSTGGTLRSYLYADSGGSTFETVGTNTIAANSTNMISFTTNGTERMKIMSGGAVGTGQSANGTSLRATLVKRGTTSVTFSMSLNTIGAWRPGFATIRVSGAQNGLQEAYAAWFIYRITGYFGAGTAINLLSSGGDTGSVSISSSSDQNSPQAFSITVTDSGATTDTMIADLDVAYHEGIISLT